MNVVGTGNRLHQNDVGDVARYLGITTSVLLAIIEVEAASRGFDAKNRPTMLTEPHVFWRELPANMRQRAEVLGLAYPHWGARPYPKSYDDRWKLWFDWRVYHAVAGARSASYGLGQTMGFNAELCGFINADAMIESYKKGEREQLFGMAGFIAGANLVRHLVNKDFSKPDSWRPFAGGYNGSGYEKNNYHVKLRDAWMKHEKRKDDYVIIPPATSPVVVYVKGMKGEEIRNFQADLATLGYRFDLGIDGRFGDETERNVRQFQTAKGLTVDGKVGPKTLQAIQSDIEKLSADVEPTKQTIWQLIVQFIIELFRR